MGFEIVEVDLLREEQLEKIVFDIDLLDEFFFFFENGFVVSDIGDFWQFGEYLFYCGDVI